MGAAGLVGVVGWSPAAVEAPVGEEAAADPDAEAPAAPPGGVEGAFGGLEAVAGAGGRVGAHEGHDGVEEEGASGQDGLVRPIQIAGVGEEELVLDGVAADAAGLDVLGMGLDVDGAAAEVARLGGAEAAVEGGEVPWGRALQLGVLIELGMQGDRRVEGEVFLELEVVAEIPAVAEAEDLEFVGGEEAPGAGELGAHLGGRLDGGAVILKEEDEIGAEGGGEVGHAFRDAAVRTAGGLVAELGGDAAVVIGEVLEPDHGLIDRAGKIRRAVGLKRGAEGVV